MRILGIDPGSQVTGYGLIEGSVRGPKALHYGILRAPRGRGLPERLLSLHRGLAAVVEEHAPDLVAIETAFYHKNARSTLVLGQVRGVLILAAMKADRPVQEFSPREVKMAVAGSGGASKEQVQYMICRMLKLAEPPPLDATDALAVAVCTWHWSRS